MRLSAYAHVRSQYERLIWITKCVIDIMAAAGSATLATINLGRLALLWAGGSLLESSLSPWSAALPMTADGWHSTPTMDGARDANS